MPMKLSRHLLVRAVSVVLRVPALFIVEAWYRTDPESVQLHYTQGQNVEQSEAMLFHVAYYSVLALVFTLIVLPLKKLVNLYMYLVSLFLLCAAHYLSLNYITTEQNFSEEDTSLLANADALWKLGWHVAAQGLISAVVAYLINLDQWHKLLLMIYIGPIFARVSGYPTDDLHRVHNFAFMTILLLTVFYIFNHIPQVLDLLKNGVQKVSLAVQVYGWIPFLLAMWFKILLPVQFLIFWTVLFAIQLYKYFSVANHPIFSEGWVVLLLASIGECCVTPISLLGVCVTVSYVSYTILAAAKLYLQGREAFMHDNVMQRGWTEGFTMFLLSVQTGLIELKAAQRAFLMSIVLFIVLSSLIQSIYEIADPILLALGASQNKSIMKHCRAIVLCTFLWLFPLYMTYIICQFFDLDFWLLVVISSCVLTSVQTIGSIIVYTLFMYDAMRYDPWESLDDVVYYTKATTRVLEFIVAVFVVGYGVRESIFGEWSWINSSILIIHCYFNVWQRLQAAWKSYLLRREAVNKVKSLPLATDEQLSALNDVCAICFQEMKIARVTPCHHFFHALCLRKWLYVQDKCPMCHQDISITGEGEEEEESGGREVELVGGVDNIEHPGEPAAYNHNTQHAVPRSSNQANNNVSMQQSNNCTQEHRQNNEPPGVNIAQNRGDYVR